MSLSFEQLRKATVTLGEVAAANITDLWIKEATGNVTHAQINLGGWFRTDDILVHVSCLSVGQEDNTWVLEMTQAQIEQAPRWPDMAQAGLVDWPPIVIGPFGTTLSMPLIGAQMRANTSADANTNAPQVTQSLERASALLGQPVFASDGEIGPVVDLRIDPTTWALEQYDVAPLRTSETAAIPAYALKHRSQKEGHLVIKGAWADKPNAHR